MSRFLLKFRRRPADVDVVMRVVRTHSARGFDSLRRRRHRRRPQNRRPAPGRPAPPLGTTSPRTVEAAVRVVQAQPAVRSALVEGASARLATGCRPTSRQIADSVVAEAVGAR